ncbi:MAG TPA: insulinase family protein, partial [Pyrinomonadaceae bacterium]|nr:insulinase family protein [Pyrinomonadaceae bacterium]
MSIVKELSRRTRQSLAVVALLAAASFPALAQLPAAQTTPAQMPAAQATPPPPAAPRNVPIPKPVERTLPNGLRVVVVERSNMPLVSASLLIRNGGEVDPSQLAGLADMTASLLTKGTQARTAPQIAEAIEALGGS